MLSENGFFAKNTHLLCEILPRPFLNTAFLIQVLLKKNRQNFCGSKLLKLAELVKSAVLTKVEKTDWALVAPCFKIIEELFVLKKACSVDESDQICLALLESVRVVLRVLTGEGDFTDFEVFDFLLDIPLKKIKIHFSLKIKILQK